MKFHSWFVDQKIRGLNVSVDMTIEEYDNLIEQILTKNELQRKRVKSQGKTYELLRKDLIDGCVMPPIILAVTDEFGQSIKKQIEEIVESQTINDTQRKSLETFVIDAVNSKELLILDGLQRTYTIQQCINETKGSGKFEKFKKQLIRTEVYLGLTKTGILYRMLTLNTGQTPMSFRHQIEILYHDYIDKDSLPDGIKVVREVDDARAKGIGTYKYSDVVDMLYAYSTGTPKSFDKQALVTQLKEIEFLEDFRFNSGSDDFISLLVAYNKLVSKIDSLSDGWHTPENLNQGQNEDHDEAVIERPFGTNVASIFNKVQPITGFGAECKRLSKLGQIKDISNLLKVIEGCSFKAGNTREALDQLIIILDQIAQKAKRIGDAQRIFFQLSFRQLFNNETEAYQDLSRCWLAAQETFETLYT